MSDLLLGEEFDVLIKALQRGVADVRKFRYTCLAPVVPFKFVKEFCCCSFRFEIHKSVGSVALGFSRWEIEEIDG